MGVDTFSTMMEIVREVLGIEGTSLAWGHGQNVSLCFRKTMGYRFRQNVVPLLLSELENRDNNPEIRSMIIESIAQINDATSISHLAEALHDPAFLVRSAAINALSKFDSPEVIEPLVSALMDSNSYIRGAAVDTLGTMKVARVVPDLVLMLNDTELMHPGKRVCDVVLRALITIKTQTALDAAVDWCTQQLSNNNDYVEGEVLSRWASSVLEIIGTPKAHAILEHWRGNK